MTAARNNAPASAASTPARVVANSNSDADSSHSNSGLNSKRDSAPSQSAAAPDPFRAHIPGEWIALVGEIELAPEPGAPAPGSTGAARVKVEPGRRIAVSERRETGEPPLAWLRVKWTEAGAAREGWAPDAQLAPPPQAIAPERLREIGSEPVDRYHGIPADYAPPDLVDLPKAMGFEKDRVYQLRREPAEALRRLVEAAAAEKIQLRVVSAYRDYETQRRVYGAKLERSGYGQTTVAKPGHSEHQLGVAVDLNNASEENLLKESFGDTPAGEWLLKRAPEFGFAISYTPANRARTGYSPEPWHYRYVGAEAAPAEHARAVKGE